MRSTNVTIPRHPKTRAEWIKNRMAERGISFAGIARRLGLHRGTPQMVLVKPYPRMEAVLAKMLDLDPAQIWPERYETHPKAVPHRNGRRQAMSSQKGRSA